MKRKTKVGPLFSAVRQLKEFAHKKLFRYMVRTGLVMCAAHTDATSFTDDRYFISATLPSSYDASGYQNTGIAYTEITLVSDFPAYGAMAEVNRFTPIYGAIKKVKRTPDYGGGNMIFAELASDPGQVILLAASASQAHYTIMVLKQDNARHFLDVIVTSFQYAPAKSGDFFIVNCNIEVNRAPVIVAAT